jgi:hypothetical protein
MSEKIWKIFGVLGIICILITIFLIYSMFSFPLSKKASTLPGTNPASKSLESPPMITSRDFSFAEQANEGVLEKNIKESSPNQLETPSRMVIKTGWINLVVKDVLETIKKIAKFAQENGGWVVASNISEHEKVPSGSITVRVPAEKFDQTKDYFRGLAVRVTNESVQSQDITEEYVDLEARLRNLEASEKQLLEIMKRSGTIIEILEVQKQLTNVRQQIEQIKGRMQYLEQSVKMSSITVNLALSEELLPVPPAEKWRPKYVLLQSWKSVMNFWKGFSYFLIKLFVWAQVWVPAIIIIYFGKKFLKKRVGK